MAAAAPPTALAALGYIRISDPKQIEGVSLDQQRAAIRAFAKRTRIPLIDILEDAGESAKTLDRPDVQELVRRLEGGEASVVIVYDLDRLSRYVPDYYELVRTILARRRGPNPESYHRIAEELATAGVSARRGSWRGSTVRQIYERRDVYRPLLRSVAAR